MTSRSDLESKIYDSLAAFNATACWDVLRLAQMRQHLAEHLAGDLHAAVLPAPADRAAVLREAAVELDSITWEFDVDTCSCGDCNLCAWKEAVRQLRRLADEAQRPGGIRGLLEHVGIDTRGRDIRVAGKVVDAADEAHPAPAARPDGTWHDEMADALVEGRRCMLLALADAVVAVAPGAVRATVLHAAADRVVADDGGRWIADLLRDAAGDAPRAVEAQR